MILVDTSLWIEHFRHINSPIIHLLESNTLCIHAWIIGELACGNLKNREKILILLNGLPRLPIAEEEEVLNFIEYHQLMGRGIGYIDAHLLTASALNTVQLWTLDKRLNLVAEKLHLNYPR
jgi:hypothetical protein